MKRALSVWQMAGFLFTGIGGVLLHFLFDWSGGSPWVAPFSAINESTWEHMKLLFFPMLVFALLERAYLEREYPTFWCVKLIGILLGMGMIPVLFYTINGVFGQTPDWVNIAIFFVASAVSYLTETWLFRGGAVRCRTSVWAFLALWGIALLFAVWTFSPPQLPLFEDPMGR